jgi:5-carboxymethyl-2-hydroxymuconate isomerase
MPHLVILYTPQLDAETDMDGLCRTLADTMLAVRTKPANRSSRPAARACWPIRRRTMRWPTAAATTPSCTSTCAWRVAAARQCTRPVGEALVRLPRASTWRRCWRSAPVGMTLQIDEGHEVFDAKFSNLHPLFAEVPDHARHRHHPAAWPARALRRAQGAHAAAPLLAAPPRHDHRRRLRHPARMGEAEIADGRSGQGPQDRPDLARDAGPARSPSPTTRR